MVEDTIVGIDVGTTTVKALLLTTGGRQLDRFSEPYPTARPSSGVVEQNADDWVNRIVGALRQFAQNFDLGGLKGIGICSQVNTHVFVGGDREALAPAIVWQDGRCAGEAAELDARVDSDQTHRMVGRAAADRRQPLPQPHGVDAKQPPRDLEQDAVGHVAKGLLRAAPDRSGGGRPDHLGRLCRPPSRLFDAAAGPRARRCGAAAAIAEIHDRAGEVSAAFPCAGAPVVVGTMDAWGGMFGVGIHHPGRAMYLSGTSEILGIVSPTGFRRRASSHSRPMTGSRCMPAPPSPAAHR